MKNCYNQYVKITIKKGTKLYHWSNNENLNIFK